MPSSIVIRGYGTKSLISDGIGTGGVATPPVPLEVSLHTYISGLLTTPIFPSKVPQRAVNIYPRITYYVVGGNSDLWLSGPSGLAYKTITFDIWAVRDIDTIATREQLRMALHGFRGRMATTWVTNSVWSEDPSSWEPGVDKNDTGTFRKTVEIKLSYYEFVPSFPSAIPVVSQPSSSNGPLLNDLSPIGIGTKELLLI